MEKSSAPTLPGPRLGRIYAAHITRRCCGSVLLVWPCTVCHCPPRICTHAALSAAGSQRSTLQLSTAQVTAAHLACSHCWRAGNCQPARLALGCTPRWPSSAQSRSSAPAGQTGNISMVFLSVCGILVRQWSSCPRYGLRRGPSATPLGLLAQHNCLHSKAVKKAAVAVYCAD
jgi:hypothetical protein